MRGLQSVNFGTAAGRDATSAADAANERPPRGEVQSWFIRYGGWAALSGSGPDIGKRSGRRISSFQPVL